MNGDFGTSLALGTLLARDSLKDQDEVARIGVTAGIAGMPLGLVLAKVLTDQAVARQGREAEVAAGTSGQAPPPPPGPVPPSPPPPPTESVEQGQAILGDLKAQTGTMGQAASQLKAVVGELKDAAKSLASSATYLEKAAKTQKAG